MRMLEGGGVMKGVSWVFLLSFVYHSGGVWFGYGCGDEREDMDTIMADRRGPRAEREKYAVATLMR
jgi:hypothetical protein